MPKKKTTKKKKTNSVDAINKWFEKKRENLIEYFDKNEFSAKGNPVFKYGNYGLLLTTTSLEKSKKWNGIHITNLNTMDSERTDLKLTGLKRGFIQKETKESIVNILKKRQNKDFIEMLDIGAIRNEFDKQN